MNKKQAIVIILIIVAMTTRFVFIVDGVSVLPNFTAVGAIAIMGATYLKGITKWLIPLALLWISDLILNNLIYSQYFDHFQIFGDPWVYGSFLLVGLFAGVLMKRASWGRLFVTCIGGAVIFYLVTNFAVWAQSTGTYPRDMNGLIMCYEAAIPFFRNTLLGNLFFGFALFGIFELLASRIKGLEPVLIKKPII